MLELYYQYRRVMVRFRSGALGDEIDRIAAHLRQFGYKHDSVKLYLAGIARFSSFAAQRGCRKSTPIAARIVDLFLDARPTTPTRFAAQVAIGHARRLFPERFAAPPTPKGFHTDPYGPLLADYLQHLQQVRGLQPNTCKGLILAARRMLAWDGRQRHGRSLSLMTAKHVLAMTHDLLTVCRSDGSRSATTACMRSFLRYLHWSDRTSQDLTRFVPRTPCWRLAHLPPRLAWEHVRQAIDAIEGDTPSGIRDRALMLMLATTGLRNKELRQLTLEDIRWRTAEVVVRRTKGHRDRIVPLLEETGVALAKYLIRSRPRTVERHVFLSHVTPVRAFAYSGTVSRIVRVRLQNAGVPVRRGGAHLLRHSLATRLVAQRRPIKEVADLLGHRNIDTTAIYVKVALSQLADVALPFPGGAL